MKLEKKIGNWVFENIRCASCFSHLRCPLCDVLIVGVVAMQKHIGEKHGMEMSLESLETFLKVKNASFCFGN